MTSRIGILGGTFDPVHHGHIAMALALHEQLSLQQMLLMPCGEHALGKQPQATAQQRFDMLHLATEDYPQLCIDNRELIRSGVSYTVDSCRELRVEQGNEAQICFVVGSDVISSLHRWHNWQQLLGLVNLVVVKRAKDQLASTVISATGDSHGKLDAAVSSLLQDAVKCIDAPHGQLMLIELPPYPYASNTIRRELREVVSMSGQCSKKCSDIYKGIYKEIDENSEKFEALDEKVLRYIVNHHLYCD